MSATFAQEQKTLGVGVRIQHRTTKHLRYVPRIDEHAHALAVGFREPGHLAATRLERLRERLWRAPLQLELIRRHGSSPEALRSPDDLAHMPLLDRETLGARWQESFALGLDAQTEAELVVATSSGSTGKALLAVRDGYDQLHMWAAIRFWIGQLGVQLPARPRLALLDALPGGLEYSTRLPHFERGALHRISTARPEPKTRVERVQPAILSSDPAGLHWLASNTPNIAPKLIMSSAQHLPHSQRHELQRWNAPLVNVYAITECGPIAWECVQRSGVFHPLQPDVIVESIAGELVVTRLRDSVVPLLRYRTGDAGAVFDDVCACGFRGRSIRDFLGRRACHFVRPGGAKCDAWNLIWLFKDLPWVGFRMTQIKPEQFLVELDGPAPMGDALLAERLALALQRLGWAKPDIEISHVPQLANGLKPEPFVCRVGS
ncbi:MAG: coenzyme synthetase [Deltaproteobacteria bacterium]|nr:coenzyme synthetase [Deltaproteobacteria bacterium]